MDRPAFTLVVVGTCTDSALVEQKLGELLVRKLPSHRVVLHVGGPVRMPAAVFALRHNLAVEPIPDASPGDELGTDRNTVLLKIGNAYVAFGKPADWPRDVRDLIHRAKATGFRVRECAGE